MYPPKDYRHIPSYDSTGVFFFVLFFFLFFFFLSLTRLALVSSPRLDHRRWLCNVKPSAICAGKKKEPSTVTHVRLIFTVIFLLWTILNNLCWNVNVERFSFLFVLLWGIKRIFQCLLLTGRKTVMVWAWIIPQLFSTPDSDWSEHLLPL